MAKNGMKVKVSVTGVKQTQAKLSELIQLASKTNPEALDEIGQRAVGILKKNTPVDSGRLRQSMGYSIGGEVTSTAQSVEDRIRPNKAKDSVVTGTNVHYADYVEYLAKNGSQGYFLRSYKQIIPMAKVVLTKAFKKVVK